ncbi:hypothetical protein HJG60_010898 [Phyllostomus discolor]|uniref:Uncharacterized protein n=1 Tax=Phyllostomus discolor TaxID=89673 RepID=A0A834AEV2_9CHIR|nr:hypothetical protein HJG60_010898 [Phyllostomus discolor]
MNERQSIDVSLSHQCFSLSLSLSTPSLKSVNISSGEYLKSVKRIKYYSLTCQIENIRSACCRLGPGLHIFCILTSLIPCRKLGKQIKLHFYKLKNNTQVYTAGDYSLLRLDPSWILPRSACSQPHLIAQVLSG